MEDIPTIIGFISGLIIGIAILIGLLRIIP